MMSADLSNLVGRMFGDFALEYAGGS